MTPLTNEDFAIVQRFCQLMSEKIAVLGLDVFVESNFRDFMQLRRKLSPATVQNPTFDPDYSNINLHNAFWLRAVDPEGDTVAMIAQRVFDTDNFLDEITSLRLWHNRPGSLPGILQYDDCDFATRLTGRVGHAGGLWIDPVFRKKNISGLIDHLGRGLLLKNFWFDYITGIISPELAATGIATKQYGWSGVEGHLSFDFFKGETMVEFGICYMSRVNAIARMNQWLLLPDCNSVQELDEFGKVLAH